MSTGIIDNRFTKHYASYLWADADVRAFGAKGDGISDDTEAFENAISAVAKAGGGTVYAPEGRYKLTHTLRLPCSVGISGDLIPGTAEGTILCIYGGKGSSDSAQGAVLLDHQASVKNLAFWYPEQNLADGTAIPYPPSVVQVGSESVTVENVNFINSYFAVCYAAGGNNSLQYTRDVCGTPLFIGYENDHSYDIGKIEDLHFAPSFWLNASLPGTPDAAVLNRWLKGNATGLLLERIDWTYLADVTVEGYKIGVRTRNAGDGAPNGHIFRFNLLNCVTCLLCDHLSWVQAADCRFTAEKTAIEAGPECKGDFLLHGCSLIAGTGIAVKCLGTGRFTFSDCNVFGGKKAFENPNGVPCVCVNSNIGDRTLKSVTVKNTPSFDRTVPYGKTVVNKPASPLFVDLTRAPYYAVPKTDISDVLQKAIDDLAGRGGTVYLPAGSYTVSKHITVREGIELRGAVSWPQSFSATAILTDFGKDDPDGEPLFSLKAGAGLRGLGFLYPEQHDTKNLHPYSYTVRGEGEGVYLVDVAMTSEWNGVDFATCRCDRHYIEYLWGCFGNNAVKIGSGSEGGVIRDCHFTPNCWSLRARESFWGDVFFGYVQKRFRMFIIGESRGEILYHNFTYGGFEGLSLRDGAKDVFTLSHGVDAGNRSVYFEGDCTATLVDSQLVNLHAVDMHYIQTGRDYTGSVDLINPAFWGPSSGAFSLRGNGKIRILGGEVVDAGRTMAYLHGDDLTVTALIDRTPSTSFVITENAKRAESNECLYVGGLIVERDENAVPLCGTDAE